MHGVVRASNVKTFGQALQKVRIEYGLSHREVSDRVGKSKSIVRDWESNLAIPPAQTLKRLYATFPELRYFTHLLPKFEVQQFMNKIDTAIDEAADRAKAMVKDPSQAMRESTREGVRSVFDEVWVPPLPKAGDEIPDKLTTVFKAKNFGENLRYLRLQEGMDQAEVGELLNVTGSAVGHWERNFVAPILDHFEKLCELFPHLRNGPRPVTKDMAKPDNRVNGYVPTGHTNGAPLRAIPNAFDHISAPPRTPEPPPPPPPPKPPEKTPAELLAEAGAEYARLVSEKKHWEAEVLQHEIEVEEAKKKLEEVQKTFEEKTKAADAAHQKIVDLATQL